MIIVSLQSFKSTAESYLTLLYIERGQRELSYKENQLFLLMHNFITNHYTEA